MSSLAEDIWSSVDEDGWRRDEEELEAAFVGDFRRGASEDLGGWSREAGEPFPLAAAVSPSELSASTAWNHSSAMSVSFSVLSFFSCCVNFRTKKGRR